MKVIAWSQGLEREIGFGYRNLVLVKSGNYYATESERLKIHDYVEHLPHRQFFISRMKNLRDETLRLLKKEKLQPSVLVDKLIEHFSCYYLARREADVLYNDTETSPEVRRQLERWRNDTTNFSAFDVVERNFARMLSISKDELGMLTVDELKDALRTRSIEKSLILKRTGKPWSYVLEGGIVRLLSREINKIVEEIPNVQISRVVHGTVVYKSKALIRGNVGKTILVAVHTSPSWTADMQKMKAVITDEGGLLSHAAITCREFKIPCIIDTKVATKILKQGDMVEVDTETGTVNVL